MAPKIADALTQHGMKVTQRSVRERFDKLYSDFKERKRGETSQWHRCWVWWQPQRTYRDQWEGIRTEEERQDKETQEKATAVEMRKRATERLSVKKRRSKDDATVSDEPEEAVSPKRRMSQTSMVDMMKESGERDNEAEISGRARTHTHTHNQSAIKFNVCKRAP